MSYPSCESLIKSVVTLRSKKGATIQQIKDDYYDLVGKELPFAQQSTKAIETFLSTIKDLHVENSSGIKLYYSDSKKQEHVKKLISSQRSAPRISSNKRSRDATECNPSYIKTRTFYANNSQRDKDNGREPNSKIRKCLNSSNRSPLRTTRKKCENQFLSLAEKWRKTVDLHTLWHNPMLLTRRMVGDDFFLNLARFELNYKCTPNHSVHQSGLCISGQTIRDAADRILTLPKGGDLLINLGSVDLLHGHEMFRMIEDTFYLIDCCQKQQINPVLTTLAPLANYQHSKTMKKQLLQYNHFLRASKFSVIDLWMQFVDEDGTVDFEYFYSVPSNVTGSKIAQLQWNKLGRVTALRQIKQQLVAWDFGSYLNTVLACF